VPSGGTVGVTAVAARVDIDPYTPPPVVTPVPVPASPVTPVAPAPKSMTTSLSYRFIYRKRTTRLSGFRLKSIPGGSTVVARCLTCRGKLGKALTTKPARTDIAIKAFDRSFAAGARLEVVITNPAYITQTKTLRVRKNRPPVVTTTCGSPKPVRC
jgi:hypothetical protein